MTEVFANDGGSVKNRLDYNFFGESKSLRTSKLYYWVKSYGDLAE